MILSVGEILLISRHIHVCVMGIQRIIVVLRFLVWCIHLFGQSEQAHVNDNTRRSKYFNVSVH